MRIGSLIALFVHCRAADEEHQRRKDGEILDPPLHAKRNKEPNGSENVGKGLPGLHFL
jgi:hypothetical protein